METLLRIGLSNAVVALFMALVVVTVACLWRRPAVLHALWLLVLVKLVTPPMVWVRVPWPTLPDAPTVAVAPTVELAPIESPPEENTEVVLDSEAVSETASGEISAEPEASGGRKPPDSSGYRRPYVESGGLRPPLARTYALCAVWLAGALAWYALALFRLRRFRRLLRHATPAPESPRQRTQRLAETLRLRRCPGVWLVPGRVAPMLWAAGGRPRILFPADLLQQIGVEQQNALLVHELAHLRRRDHWVRWLEFIAAGLYWWNPVLWFARRVLREAEEQCCDAWVTSTLPGAGKTYATALLETLDFLSDAPPAMPLLASGVGRVVDLKRRLTMIMRGTTPRTLGWRGVAAVVGLGALLLPLLPAWVQAQAPAKAETVKKDNVLAPGDINVLAGEAEKDGAELEMLRAELAKKQAEVAGLTARIKAVTARAKKRQGNSFVQTAIFDGGTKGRIIVQTDGPLGKDRIIVQTDGAASDPAKIQELLEKIQAAVSKSVFPEVLVTDKTTGKVIMKMEGGKAEVVGSGALSMPPPAGMRWVGPGDPGYHPGQPPLAIAASETDKRIIELEMKLKSILSEVEQLRQERKPAQPKPVDSESKPQSNGPAPLDKVPYINDFFKAVGPATAQEQQISAAVAKRDAELQKRLVDSQAEYGKEKDRNLSLTAERDILQAKLKEAAHQWERERGQAEDAQSAAEKALRMAEANRKRLVSGGGKGVNEATAPVDAMHKELEEAAVQLEKQAADHQATQAKLITAAASIEAQLRDSATNLSQLELEIRKLKDAVDFGKRPTKP